MVYLPREVLQVLQTSRPHADAVVDRVSSECLRQANIVWSSDLSEFHKVKPIMHGLSLLLAMQCLY